MPSLLIAPDLWALGGLELDLAVLIELPPFSNSPPRVSVLAARLRTPCSKPLLDTSASMIALFHRPWHDGES